MTRVHNGRARRAVQLAIPPVVEGVIWGTADTHRPLETWWPGAIPAASLVKIEGRKSTGKSTVAAAIAASISGGPVVPGWTGPTDRRVLWQSGEEDWDRIVGPRLRRAGVPVGMYGRLTARTTRGDPRRVVLPDDLPILSDAIREGGVGLVVLDPYSSLVGSSIDLSVPQQARLWLELIAETFAAAQAVCLCVGHVRKGRGGDSREAGYGCAETANVMRSIMRCDEHPHQAGERVLTVVSHNQGRAAATRVYRLVGPEGELPGVLWCGTSDLDADAICEGRGAEGERDEWGDADRLLHETIGSGWVLVGDVEREALTASISPRTLRRAKARLRIPSRRVQGRDGGHWEWGPPASGWPDGLRVDPPADGGGPGGGGTLGTVGEGAVAKPCKSRRSRKAAKVAIPPAPPPSVPAEGVNHA